MTTADTPSASDGYRLAVAVGNPETVPQLMRTAVDVARDQDGAIVVISVIVEPRGSPFGVFETDVIKREFAGERTEILDRAVTVAEGSGVPVEGQLLVAPSVSRAVLRGVAEFDCDAVLLGWHERRRRDAVFGNNVDAVMAAAPCGVHVERIGPTANGVESLLLPVVEGPHTELATEVARSIATANDTRVDVVHVVDPGSSAEARSTADSLVAATEDRLDGVATEGQVREHADVTASLLDLAVEHDVTVFGATRRHHVRRRLAGSIPLTIGREAPCTVVISRSGGGVRSRLRRLFV